MGNTLYLPMKRLLQPRLWPLRIQARVLVCALFAGLSIAFGQLWGARVALQIESEAGAQQLQIARNMADRLSSEMAARARDVRLLSQLDILRNADDPATARAALEKLRDTLPAYAWIGMTDAQGQVIASTGDVLLGVSIATRPVFKNGRQGLWTGDVHDAVMLAKLAPHAPGEAVKFVDVAAPVLGTDGQLRGVLALHLSWQWADQLRQSVLQPRGGGKALQLTIVGADGKTLLAAQGERATVSLSQERLKALEEHWASERWSDGNEAVTSVAESRGQGDFHGFGWRVVAHDGAGMTSLQMMQARQSALAWSLGLGSACALLACWLIGVIVAPVDELATALGRKGDARPNGTPMKRRNDVQQIAAAVAHLQDTLRDRDETLQSLELKAHRDPLTGLWNRQYLAECSPRLTKHATDNQLELCVLCLDLDGFKPVNDRYGHEAGDQVLMQIAKRLRQAARDEDIVFRLGGDEFMMLLSCPRGEGEALARVVAARVLKDLRRPFSYRTLSNLRVGCSIGAAQWPQHGLTLVDAMRHADEALYAAKRDGRGQLRQYSSVTAGATLSSRPEAA